MLARETDYDFAVSRVYYFRKHSAVHAAYGEQFAKTEILDPKFHRWLLDSSDKRLLGDYEVGVTLTSDDVEQMIDQAKEFLAATKHYLAKDSTQGPASQNP